MQLTAVQKLMREVYQLRQVLADRLTKSLDTIPES
jgi:hypothetical protein